MNNYEEGEADEENEAEGCAVVHPRKCLIFRVDSNKETRKRGGR